MKPESQAGRTWQAVGDPDPTALVGVRLQLHWATQIIAAAPLTFLEPAPDYSHVNLGWESQSGTLWTRSMGGDDPIRVGIRFSDLALVIHRNSNQTIAELPLPGRTLEQGYEWLGQNLRIQRPGTLDGKTLERTGEGIPHHPVAEGAAFPVADSDALAELGRWFTNATLVLSEVERNNEAASEVRCWPHHFDIATLITLASSDDPEQSHTVGVGLTPGDEYYAEPYFYVTPWPYPDRKALRPLDGAGFWHTEGWIGAVLPGSTIVAAGNGAEEQAAVASSYLDSAILLAKELAGGRAQKAAS